MADLPKESLAELERITLAIEALQPALMQTLGYIATQEASQPTVDWTLRLDDAIERGYLVFNALFEHTVELPKTAPEVPADPPPENPQSTGPLDEVEVGLVRYLADNPRSRLEVIRREVPGLEDITTTSFATFRKQIQIKLAEAGIAMEFDTEGRTRGTMHFILVDDENVGKLSELIWPGPTEPEEVASIEEPVPILLEADVEVSLNGSQPIDSTETTGPTLTDDQLEQDHLANPVLPAGLAQSLLQSGETTNQLPNDNELIEYFSTQSELVGIGRITADLCGKSTLPKSQADALKKRVSALVRSGALVKIGKNGYAAADRRAEFDTSASPVVDEDFEAMMRTRGMRSNPSAFKPAQRNGRPTKRRRR